MVGRSNTFPRYLVNLITKILPPTRFYGLKASLWRAAGIEVAEGARLVSSVHVWTSGKVSIGADTFIGHEVMIVGGDASVRIGARCDIAPRVLIVTGTHLDGGRERAAGPGVSRPVAIGDGVWIGAASTILGGVEIGDGAIVAAGSLVKDSVPPNIVVGGVPCRILRERAFDETALR